MSPAVTSGGLSAQAVWDVLLTALTTGGSIGELLKALQFAPFSYGPTTLASAAAYIPAAGTMVFNANINGTVDAEDKFLFSMTGTAFQISADAFLQNDAVNNIGALVGVFYCDGTSGFYQATGSGQDLRLLGVTMN